MKTINYFVKNAFNKIAKLITVLVYFLGIKLEASVLNSDSKVDDDEALLREISLVNSNGATSTSEIFDHSSIGQILLIEFKKLNERITQDYYKKRNLLDKDFARLKEKALKIADPGSLLEIYKAKGGSKEDNIKMVDVVNNIKKANLLKSNELYQKIDKAYIEDSNMLWDHYMKKKSELMTQFINQKGNCAYLSIHLEYKKNSPSERYNANDQYTKSRLGKK